MSGTHATQRARPKTEATGEADINQSKDTKATRQNHRDCAGAHKRGSHARVGTGVLTAAGGLRFGLGLGASACVGLVHVDAVLSVRAKPLGVELEADLAARPTSVLRHPCFDPLAGRKRRVICWRPGFWSVGFGAVVAAGTAAAAAASTSRSVGRLGPRFFLGTGGRFVWSAGPGRS